MKINEAPMKICEATMKISRSFFQKRRSFFLDSFFGKRPFWPSAYIP